MKVGNKFYMSKPGEEPKFRLTVTSLLEPLPGSQSKYVSISVDVEEVTEWGEGENGKYDKPFAFEDYLGACLKWDGCSHIWYGEIEEGRRDAYHHLCGGFCFERHAWLMRCLFHWASKVLPMDKKCADVSECKRPEFEIREVLK